MTYAGVDGQIMLASAPHLCWQLRHNVCQLDDKCVDDQRFYQSPDGFCTVATSVNGNRLAVNPSLTSNPPSRTKSSSSVIGSS